MKKHSFLLKSVLVPSCQPKLLGHQNPHETNKNTHSVLIPCFYPSVSHLTCNGFVAIDVKQVENGSPLLHLLRVHVCGHLPSEKVFCLAKHCDGGMLMC